MKLLPSPTILLVLLGLIPLSHAGNADIATIERAYLFEFSNLMTYSERFQKVVAERGNFLEKKAWIRYDIASIDGKRLKRIKQIDSYEQLKHKIAPDFYEIQVLIGQFNPRKGGLYHKPSRYTLAFNAKAGGAYGPVLEVHNGIFHLGIQDLNTGKIISNLESIGIDAKQALSIEGREESRERRQRASRDVDDFEEIDIGDWVTKPIEASSFPDHDYEAGLYDNDDDE